MGRIQIILDKDVETTLRDLAKRKGDLSEIVNKALRKYLEM